MVMTMDTAINSQTATEEEIAQAAQEAVETFKKERVQTGQEVGSAREIPGSIKPMQYRIPAQDEATWVMVWELKLDANGEVYGDPTRAPRQQLGLWLTKKREDGGPRFSVDMPSRLRADATIPCLFNGAPHCSKKFYTRQDMVMHVRATHQMFAQMNRVLLDSIMDRVAQDNPRLAQMAEAIANMTDPGLVSVAVDPVARPDRVDPDLGKPTVQTLGIQRDVQTFECALCEWTPKDTTENKKQALYMHTIVKHKDEL